MEEPLEQEAENAPQLTRNKPFMLLMAAQLVSNVGDWLHFLALLTMVGMKWNASPWEITALSLCMAVPMLLGGPLAGYASDRLNRKALMIGSDLVRAGIVAGLVFAGSLWQVYVLLLAKGVMDVLFSPAKSGKLKELVPPSQMDAAVGLSASIEQITKIIGPALGGLLVAGFGISACYVIDSFTYLLSAVLLLGLPGTRIAAPQQENEETRSLAARASFREGLGAGLRIIVGMPVVLCGTIMLILALLVVQIADSQLVTLFRDISGVSEDLLGWCVGASGLGTLLSALVISRMGSSRRPLVFMGAGAVLVGVVFAGAAIATAYLEAGIWMYAGLLASFLLAGAGAGMAFIPFQSMLQQRTPEAYTGRVFGTVNSLTSAAVILGPVAGGALVTAAGAVPAYIVSGALTMAIGMALLFLRSIIEKKDASVTLQMQEAVKVMV